MSETYILPSDYYQTILTAARTGNRRELARTFRNTSEQRHPKLTAVYPQCYYVPVSTASMLYREAPTRYRSLALAALGPTTSPGYWGRMAVIARDAFDATDWTLLGWAGLLRRCFRDLRPDPQRTASRTGSTREARHNRVAIGNGSVKASGRPGLPEGLPSRRRDDRLARIP